jgi:hypothetical protein|tara:strand:- start:6448 stop:6609 length:162 start_codon:yes stop_codon:yes gene_type:complete
MLIASFPPLAYAEQINSSIAVEILATKFSRKTQNRVNEWIYMLISTTVFMMTI